MKTHHDDDAIAKRFEMKRDWILDPPVKLNAEIEEMEAHILKKMSRRGRRKGRKIAHALALLWPQIENVKE